MRCAVSSDELDKARRRTANGAPAGRGSGCDGRAAREALADRGLALRNGETGTAYAATASIEMA